MRPSGQPGWFGPPGRRLFGWLHTPADGVVRAGMVLCPPLQSDYYASHGTYRRLAEDLAAAGMAALRFDYFASGDSEGYPEEAADVNGWVDDIGAAVADLRARGVGIVGLGGMRMGATLADAARHHADLLVLWDPCPKGRSYLREATLLLRQAAEFDGAGLPNEPLDGTAPRVVGFGYPESFCAGLAGLRIATTAPMGPALVLTRTGKLPAALAAWTGGPGDGAVSSEVEVATAAGQPELLETFLDLVEIPEEAVRRVVTRCEDRVGKLRPDGSADTMTSTTLDRTTAVLSDAGTPVTETVTWLPGTVPTDPDLFAITTSPASPADPDPLTVLCVGGGNQHRSGANRLYVELSRQLAADGIVSLRFDLSGIGDTPARPGEPGRVVFSPRAMDDLRVAVSAATPDPDRLAVIGLCSGAYHALEAAALTPVRGVVAVHPSHDFGPLTKRSHLAHPSRKIWVSDRPWLAWMDKYRWTRTAKWHAPAVVWRALAAARLQPDLAGGIVALAGTPTDTVLLFEPHRLARPRLWRLRKGVPGLTVVLSTGDHSLVDHLGRQQVAAVLRDRLRAWAAAGRQP